jgi:hypothetical protein
MHEARSARGRLRGRGDNGGRLRHDIVVVVLVLAAVDTSRGSGRGPGGDDDRSAHRTDR